MVKIINPTTEFLGADEVEAIKRHQRISESFMERLKQERIATQSGGFGEIAKIGSIPHIFVYKWLNEGFVLEEQSPAAIRKRLINEGLEGFLSTDKRL